MPATTPRYRILYHHRTQGRGAEGHHIVSIVTALRELGHQVDLLSPRGVDPFKLVNQPPVDKARTRTRGTQRLWSLISRHAPNWLFELLEIGYNLIAGWKLRQALKKTDYDFIYERYAFFLIAGGWAARRYGVPLVLEANEVTAIPDRARRQVFANLCERFEHYLFARCQQVLPVSSYLAELGKSRAPESVPFFVTPNAIDPAKIMPRPKSAELIDKYQLAGKQVIGFAGWFDHWDRLDLLLQGLNKLSTRYPQACLLLIGDGPGLSELTTQATALNLQERVILTGKVPRDQVLDYLQLLDIAVLPHSNPFGSPIILFEFFGLKIPVVAPRLPPLEDVITSNENGLLFTPLDIDGCTTAVEQLLVSESLRHSIADRAQAQLLAKHTWQRNVEAVIAQFESLSGAKKQGDSSDKGNSA